MWHSDIFVLPSRREALGVSIIEAMAASMAVVGAAEGGIPEIVTGESGLLFASRHPEVLAEKLEALFTDVELLRKLQKAAPLRAKAFDSNLMIDELRKVYSEHFATMST
jgi:glycosyltransferase involved in cell wall biosynthesis